MNTNLTYEKIQSFAAYRPGWSFGEGVEFTQPLLNKSLQLAKTAHALGFHKSDAFPGLNGEVMITIYRETEYWEFTIQPDESLSFVYEKGNSTVIYEEGLPFEFAISVLTNLAFQHQLFIPKETIAKVFA